MKTSGRVVIAGLGVVSPIGIGKDAFWQSPVAGKSGVDHITAFDASPLQGGGGSQSSLLGHATYPDAREKRSPRWQD